MTRPQPYKLTELAVGGSLTGTILNAEAKTITTKTGTTFEGVYITLQTETGPIQVQTAGNIKKFFKQDAVKGMYAPGRAITITRKEDVKLRNGFSTSNFVVEDAVVTLAPSSKKAELEAKLKAQRTNG